MPFVEEILKYHSLSIVGMEKNVGKTVTLNYVLQRLSQYDKSIAVTSIGIDGEGIDQVTHTAKPEIVLSEGTIFSTSEKHYLQKQLVAEIVDLSEYRTSLGRLITARALSKGKLMLSGPADTSRLLRLIKANKALGVDITIVDGALSRKSLASPSVTESMILATGAAYSINPKQLIRGTAFMCSLIKLEGVDCGVAKKLFPLAHGVYAIDDNGEVKRLDIPSAILFERNKEELLNNGKTIYVNGVVSDKLLDFIKLQKECGGYEIVVKDFTQLFISPEVYTSFTRKGGRLKVLYGTNLLAVTLNPTSPNGYALDSASICTELSNAIGLPVYDIYKLNQLAQ